MNEQMERYESVESAEQSSGPGLVQRVIAVFTSPTQLGDWLRLSSPWFLVLAIVTVVGLVLAFLVPVDLIVAAAEEQIEASGRPGAAAPSAMVLRSVVFATSLLGPLVGALVIAGVLYGFGHSPHAGQAVNMAKNGLYIATLLLGFEMARSYLLVVWGRVNSIAAFVLVAILFTAVAVAPGQYAVFYHGDRCLGGAVIDRVMAAEDCLRKTG